MKKTVYLCICLVDILLLFLAFLNKIQVIEIFPNTNIIVIVAILVNLICSAIGFLTKK